MFRLALQSLRFYWRPNLGVFVGTLLASAVLTGALLVGDSVDYSLRRFAMLRLGEIHHAIDSRSQFVRQDLGERLGTALETNVAAVLRLQGMAIYQGSAPEARSQINKVEVVGIDNGFWSFGEGPPIDLQPHETALNAKLAEALGVSAGGEISLRIAKPSLMARDSPLSARDEERSRRARFTVTHILTDEQMGRFGLAASQTAPYNAFVNRAFLQDQVELGGRVNLLLAGATKSNADGVLSDTWRPSDIGLSLRAHPSGVVQLESDRIFLGGEMARAATAIPGARGTLTYLVNSLAKGEKLTPYFFVVAGPVPGDLADDQIVINRWVADELSAGVGDTLTLAYAELMPSNEFVNRDRVFTVHSIREMDDLVTERELMPTFPGLSDVDSCSEWDVGMPMDETLLNDEANEAYWDTYRATPKAFVTLAAGQAMWANRFGNLTAVRYEGDGARAAEIEAELQRTIDPALAGLAVQPVREQALSAVSNAMDFGGLFLGMSFFLIVAALLLTGLLFIFGVQQRAMQMGTLLAVGFRPNQVRRILLSEGFIVASAGALLGALAGTIYTRLLIHGLSQYWGGAVANAAILYHAQPATLLLGGAITLVCAVLTMALAIRRLSKSPARELLTMDFAQSRATRPGAPPKKWALYGSIAGILAAFALIAAAQVGDFANVSMIFFGAGALLLASGIGLFRYAIKSLDHRAPDHAFTLRRLATLNLGRRSGRSVAVAALLACGCFLVFAVSSMQEDLTAHADRRDSGTGGFALVADATFPLLENPVTALNRPDVTALPIKVRDGDDASCLNLNQAQTPRLLGVNPEQLAALGAFADPAKSWSLLGTHYPDGTVPALIGDTNTAMWTLKKKSGVDNGDVLVFKDEAGNPVNVKLVGQLPTRLSVFQGSVLISQEHFTRMFPSEDGFRMFLIDAPASETPAVAADLAREFDRFGLDAIPAVNRILEYYTVESTYLAMFLVLGGLGLAIGTLGMAVVVLRNLIERRGELAMLKAVGFRAAPLRNALLTEYGLLLFAGLGIGGIAALIAAIPVFLAANSTVDTGAQLRIAVVVLAAGIGCMLAAILSGLRKIDYAALRNE